MKKILLLAFSAAILFTAVPTQAVTAASCPHSKVDLSWFWVPEGHGYTHPYKDKDGNPAVCDVTIEIQGYYEICRSCKAITKTVYTGKKRDNHQNKSHNTW